MRDIEAAFTVNGRSVLTRTAASQVAERLWDDSQAFATRSLAEIGYLFVDGVAERRHLGQRREAVLAAWGIDRMGNKHLLSLLPDLKARGLNDPVLIVTDSVPGLIRAVEEILPTALRQRWLAHKLRNL